MSLIVTDIEQLYLKTWGSKPYHIDKIRQGNAGADRYKINTADTRQYLSNMLTKDSKGVEIWLPVWLGDLPADIGDNGDLFLPYTTVRITASSTIIRTALAERIGTVKEQYNTDDYKITVKGFFIDKDKRLFPEKDIQSLKKIHELGRAFTLHNGVSDVFLSHRELPPHEQKRVVLTSFDLPEVEGGRREVRPFSMTLESDCVFKLEVE